MLHRFMSGGTCYRQRLLCWLLSPTVAVSAGMGLWAPLPTKKIPRSGMTDLSTSAGPGLLCRASKAVQLSLWVLDVCRVLQLRHERRGQPFTLGTRNLREGGRVAPPPRGVQHEGGVQLRNPVSRSPTQLRTGHKEGQKGCEERCHDAWVKTKDSGRQSYSPQLLAQVGTPDGGSASESARCDVHDAEAVSVQKSLDSSWIGALEVAVQDLSLLPTSTHAHSLARCSLGVQLWRGFAAHSLLPKQ